MKILFHNYYNSLNIDNKLFELNDTEIGDDLLKPFNRLNEVSKNQDVEVGTYTKISPEIADAFVFIDYPKNQDPIFEYAKTNTKAKLYLLILESPIVNLDNFNLSLHNIFEKVFTWSDDLVELNPDKYIKINYSFDIPKEIPSGFRSKFITIISGNKLSRRKNELYSERLNCIKWFEKNKPSQLDLYGTNWDIVKFENETSTGIILNKINSRLKLFKYHFSVYKGKIARKKNILSQYNFCICFENVANKRGYITEKIFDCFFSGTIPVYKGANNISEYIPQNCFIDYNQFSGMEELYSFLSSLSDDKIQKYQNNIFNYLNSNQIEQFSISTFCNTLLKNLK